MQTFTPRKVAGFAAAVQSRSSTLASDSYWGPLYIRLCEVKQGNDVVEE